MGRIRQNHRTKQRKLLRMEKETTQSVELVKLLLKNVTIIHISEAYSGTCKTSLMKNFAIAAVKIHKLFLRKTFQKASNIPLYIFTHNIFFFHTTLLTIFAKNLYHVCLPGFLIRHCVAAEYTVESFHCTKNEVFH